tara:strand:- start:6172 stop:6747 length:576 start_codon:yes stop_codon:yes gene_type:complete
MIKIGILGAIGSGKTFVSKQFGLPVFNADKEVLKIYKKNKICFKKIKNKFDKYQLTFPLKKKDLGKIILDNNKNIKELNKIVHPLVRKEINFFYKKNKYKKAVVLDIPLLLENNIYDKNFILVFVDSNKKQILKRLKKRKNYNSKIFKILQKIQLPVEFKRKKSDYIIKNNFIKSSLKKNVKLLKKNLFNK